MRIGGVMHLGRHPAAFIAEQQAVVDIKGEIEQRLGSARCEQDQSSAVFAGGLKGLPIGMARNLRLFGIIHAGALQPALRKGKSAWLDDVNGDAKTGGGAQNRADIARNLWLIERNPHRAAIAGQPPECDRFAT